MRSYSQIFRDSPDTNSVSKSRLINKRKLRILSYNNFYDFQGLLFLPYFLYTSAYLRIDILCMWLSILSIFYASVLWMHTTRFGKRGETDGTLYLLGWMVQDVGEMSFFKYGWWIESPQYFPILFIRWMMKPERTCVLL